MKFENTEVWGFKHALRGMRNPLESWKKSDSSASSLYKDFFLGDNDMKLAQTLIRAGEPHRKFLRQIFVSVDITAPLYWWKEFDTYKVGTVANSTSTMHKLASTSITKECFEMDDFEDFTFVIQEDEICAEFYNANKEWEEEIHMLESLRLQFVKTKEKKYWKELIRRLPESWLQTRTITMNYENVLNIVKYRMNHKLTEWSESFMNWVKTLPYSNELLFVDKKCEVDFVMKYENGVYKCKYNSGEEFESSDGVNWNKIL